MARVLVDANVLVYTYDRGEHEKQGQAIRVLETLHAAGLGHISVQSLAEFYSATTKRNAPILTADDASRQVENLAQAWEVVELTAQIVLEAVRGVRDHGFSYWDAQIWAAARLNQIPIVLSEDFQNGAFVEGVRFLNPFDPKFDLRKIVS